MQMTQEVIPSGGGASYKWENDHICVKCASRHADGRVTVVEDRLKPGFHLANHFHKKMTEIFYILDGRVTFKFENETVMAERGMTVNIPPNVTHEVSSPEGAQLLTVFSPGGFDKYLAELAQMSEAQLSDAKLMTQLAEKYDTWMV